MFHSEVIEETARSLAMFIFVFETALAIIEAITQ
jgi:hypothetical protein